MKTLDWLQVVGWYAVSVAMMLVLGVAVGRTPFGGPLSTGIVVVPPMIAANMVIRAHGAALPLPWRLLATTMAVLVALAAVVIAIGQATVGWEGGWKQNVAFAGACALVYPLLTAALLRRKARYAASA